MSKQSLLLIDGFNLLSRAHFATSYNRNEEQLKNKNGVYTNALRVFFQKVFNLIRDHEITHLSILWDVKREETTRRQKYSFYKATRFEMPEPLLDQYFSCREILDTIGVHQLSQSPYEADDLMGAFSKKWPVDQCFIYSNDRDLLQLLSPTTSQIIASKQGELIYTINHFQSDYGIIPEHWVDVKALLGDTSDNIPGCPGIGEKSAFPLIQQYGTIERLYECIDALEPHLTKHRKKLIKGQESTFISKELASIICDIPELSELTLDELQLNIQYDMLRTMIDQYELKINVNLVGA
ncbi:5'-3' exonuclease [Paenibacillus sp. SC116]|uniref:5'-3' exonuclease n=1 Tax=Paenibacillus sp. SC116 TaxID=2968986 RepID=UPI0028110665|nr:5'-3' exonuclease [Paenibacillus sp. SC116]